MIGDPMELLEEFSSSDLPGKGSRTVYNLLDDVPLDDVGWLVSRVGRSPNDEETLESLGIAHNDAAGLFLAATEELGLAFAARHTSYDPPTVGTWGELVATFKAARHAKDHRHLRLPGQPEV
jgi:hypothetical protein